MSKERLLTDDILQEIADQLEIANKKREDKDYTLYGFQLFDSESAPSSKVVYIEDAVGMEPAFMDYTNGRFDYGSWKDAFFMPRPCMVGFDGEVKYYLNPNDYTKKAAGGNSDISDPTYSGNAMMEWGQNGKKIWYKIDGNKFYICDKKLDDGFHDWSFINCDGDEVDHFYTAIYNGSKDTNNVMRSLSGQAVSKSLNTSQELTAIGLNNQNSKNEWYSDVFADRVLINILLVLIGKSTNTQTVFGKGIESGSDTAFNAYVTGALNDKGLFFGYNDSTHAVKVFGMENWWALQWRRTAGLVIANGTVKYKLTMSTDDGTTVSAYNTDGTGYIDSGVDFTDQTSGQYITKMKTTALGAWVPEILGGSSTTHLCDACWFNTGATTYALFGGNSYDGARCGAFSCGLSAAASNAHWDRGCALSLKPLA